jgi:hypothetical protein
VEKIKTLFSSYTENEFAEILADGILNVDGFDGLSLGLFSKIIDAERHPVVASLAAKSLTENPSKDKQKVRDKIERLITTSDKHGVSEVYRNTLSVFLKDMSYGKTYSFDRDLENANYRLILLDLLLKEKKKDRLGIVIEQISRELKIVIQKADLEYLRLLVDILNKKKTDDQQIASLFEGIDREITVFVENNVFNEELPEDFKYLVDYSPCSVAGIDLYLKKIFSENRVNNMALNLFLKFFPEKLILFYDSLEKKRADIEFMETLMRNLKTLDNALALNMLEQIYSSSNDYIKIEALRAMREMNRSNKEFLISILSEGDVFLKKEVLLILKKDESARREALEKLFSIKGPWWIKNRILLDNITAVGEVGLRDAGEYLSVITKKHFFWNWNIKRRAKEVLDKWKL